jgi:hypothetical protein
MLDQRPNTATFQISRRDGRAGGSCQAAYARPKPPTRPSTDSHTLRRGSCDAQSLDIHLADQHCAATEKVSRTNRALT